VANRADAQQYCAVMGGHGVAHGDVARFALLLDCGPVDGDSDDKHDEEQDTQGEPAHFPSKDFHWHSCARCLLHSLEKTLGIKTECLCGAVIVQEHPVFNAKHTHMFQIEEMSGNVLAVNVPNNTTDVEICKIAQMNKKNSKSHAKIALRKTRTVSDLFEQVVVVVWQDDASTMLNPDDPAMVRLAAHMEWTRDVPLVKWRGCTFEGRTLLKLDINTGAAWTEKTLPDAICTFVKLHTLCLYDQYMLQRLPDALGKLTYLQILDCNGCYQLQKLPNSIGQCTQLQTLNCAFCERLTELPQSIGQLCLLTLLDCYSTDLRCLPNTINQLTQLRELDCRLCDHLVPFSQEIQSQECVKYMWETF
jgi:hypothetical protein